MKRSSSRARWSPPRSAFAGFRFPAEVIVVAVRWYLRYNLSYRDVEELLVERGIEVDHVTIFRWVQRFTPLLADAARFTRHSPGDRWFVDETYVKVNGVWRYVYRAVDQYGQVIDVLVSARRDAAAARRFFQRALRMLKVTPALPGLTPPRPSSRTPASSTAKVITPRWPLTVSLSPFLMSAWTSASLVTIHFPFVEIQWASVWRSVANGESDGDGGELGRLRAEHEHAAQDLRKEFRVGQVIHRERVREGHRLLGVPGGRVEVVHNQPGRVEDPHALGIAGHRTDEYRGHPGWQRRSPLLRPSAEVDSDVLSIRHRLGGVGPVSNDQG
ncbi:IS6 family transposase [Plantactinospora solaniradicis]|uniref:IS6 family transposase n=1 Tax=Plantactinospora solaniradicis TaxID=1723736 RepID=A0ABW1KHL2_9ACTN